MVARWEDAEATLVAAALDDLRADGEVAPALAAFAGANPRFVAWLRPFGPGGYHDPVIELLALAAPLDCDRLLLSMSGRAWPMDEPPAVEADGDARQRVLILHGVDAAHGAPQPINVMHPLRFDEHGPRLGARREPGPAAGWIPQALRAAVTERERLRAPWADIADQARRVTRLGHVLCLPPDVRALMARHADAR